MARQQVVKNVAVVNVIALYTVDDNICISILKQKHIMLMMIISNQTFMTYIML